VAAESKKTPRMNRPPSRCHILLIAGVALVAMAIAHALSLAGTAVSYRHIAVGPAVDLAIGLIAAGAFCAIRRAMHASRKALGDPDWALPAFGAIKALGAGRTIGLVLAIQFIALVAGEALEQRVAGVALVGLSALFGSTLAFAPLVHCAVGIVAGAILWFASREVCRHAAHVIGFVSAIVEWISRRADIAIAPPRDRRAIPVAPSHLRPIAFFLANRPPPFSVTLA